MKLLAFLTVIALAGVSQEVAGCRVMKEDLSSAAGLAEFESIFIGSVVSLELTNTIEQLRKHSELEVVELAGGSFSFEYGVFPNSVLRGEAAEPQVSMAGGCTVYPPSLMERVMVFRRRDGSSVFRVLKGEDSELVERVKACLAGKC